MLQQLNLSRTERKVKTKTILTISPDYILEEKFNLKVSLLASDVYKIQILLATW